MLVTVGKFKFHRVTGPDVKQQWVNKWVEDGNGAPYTKVGIKGECGQVLDTESSLGLLMFRKGGI